MGWNCQASNFYRDDMEALKHPAVSEGSNIYILIHFLSRKVSVFFSWQDMNITRKSCQDLALRFLGMFLMNLWMYLEFLSSVWETKSNFWLQGFQCRIHWHLTYFFVCLLLLWLWIHVINHLNWLLHGMAPTILVPNETSVSSMRNKRNWTTYCKSINWLDSTVILAQPIIIKPLIFHCCIWSCWYISHCNHNISTLYPN